MSHAFAQEGQRDGGGMRKFSLIKKKLNGKRLK